MTIEDLLNELEQQVSMWRPGYSGPYSPWGDDYDRGYEDGEIAGRDDAAEDLGYIVKRFKEENMLS